MYKYGRGFYYTKTDSGLPLRNEKDKEIVQKLYNDYHKGLTDLVRNKLENNDSCIIVDCHSFSDTPFETDLIKLKENEKRPDICIGTDEFHTPEWLIRIFTFLFEKEGFSVQINNPYSGTIVPLEFYKKDVRVKSFMIEINRKLFIDNNKINKNKINKLNKTIQKIFCYL
jgi:N-formylglutamate deformylase